MLNLYDPFINQGGVFGRFAERTRFDSCIGCPDNGKLIEEDGERLDTLPTSMADPAAYFVYTRRIVDARNAMSPADTALYLAETHGWKIFPACSRTKSSRGHEIFLSVAAQQILRAHPRRTNPDGSSRDLIFGSAGPFTGWSHAKTKIDARIAAATGKPLPAWVPHDLRRRLFHARKRARLGAAARHRSVSRSYQWFPSGGCRHIQSSALSVRNAHSMATLG